MLMSRNIILILCWKYHSWYNVDRQEYLIGVMLTKKNMTELTLYNIIIYQKHPLRRLHFTNTLAHSVFYNIQHYKIATIYLCSCFPGLPLTQPCKSVTILSRSTVHRDPSFVSHCHCHWLSPNDIDSTPYIIMIIAILRGAAAFKELFKGKRFLPLARWVAPHQCTGINITTTTKTRTSKRRSKTLLAP